MSSCPFPTTITIKPRAPPKGIIEPVPANSQEKLMQKYQTWFEDEDEKVRTLKIETINIPNTFRRTVAY